MGKMKIVMNFTRASISLTSSMSGVLESPTEETTECELLCRRSANNESLRELAQDIRHLMSLAYPGENSSLYENIARSYLVDLG
jgi:hypothetical protein